MSAGFYAVSTPVDASYTDQIVVKIATPRGSEMRKRIAVALTLALAPLGVANCGNLDPVEELNRNQ
jgi:hypothetical protein